MTASLLNKNVPAAHIPLTIHPLALAGFLLLTGLCCCRAAEPATGPWDIQQLSQVPKATFGERKGLLQEVYYEGEPLAGKATRVFAYYAHPDGAGPFPAVVLVHGGGGKAFPEWAEIWARRGYAAVAMDLAGCGPDGQHLADGGPAQSDEVKFREFTPDQVKDMWSYHAVAAVIRGHSLLAAQKEVNPRLTAITGISWGGYLTCIVAGLDHRFKAAVPVYGCGFIHEDSYWVEPCFKKMSPATRDLWVRDFEPSRYLPFVRCPMLFLNGTTDFAYPLDSHQKSAELVKAPVTHSIRVAMPHGHYFSEYKEVFAFIDSVLKRETPLAKISPMKIETDPAHLAAGTVSVAFQSVRPITNAVVNYAIAAGAWQGRSWMSVPARIEKGRVVASLPTERPIVIFVSITDDRGLLVSTPHQILPPVLTSTNSAIVPVPKLEDDVYDWYARHAAVLEAKQGFDPEIVLIGDSITHFWGGDHPKDNLQRGPNAWNQAFAGRRVLNLGFGWDRTQNVLWRLDHGEFDGLKPRHVVIHIGTNNLTGTANARENTPAEIAEGIAEICRRIRTQSPGSHIILMGVFPRGAEADNPFRSKIIALNQLLAQYAKVQHIMFLDIGSKMLQADGSLSTEIMSDGVHPTEKGYAIWAEALRPALN